MKKRPKVTEKPFSPALNGLIAAYIQGANQQVVAALEAEAQHLGLPKGTTFNVQKRIWCLPAPKRL